MTAVVSWTIPSDLRVFWQLALAFCVTFVASLAARRRQRVIARVLIIGIAAGVAHLAFILFYVPPLPPVMANDVVVYRVFNWPTAVVAAVTAGVLALVVDLVVSAVSRRKRGLG